MRLFLMLVVLLMVQYKTFGQCWNPDSNLDGYINSSDLLSFLGVFDGPYSSPCDTIPPQYNACTNQDSLEYNGYTYALVSIGEQCWFAENLRTMQYRNGNGISFITDYDEWYLYSYEGAVSFFNNSVENYLSYGALYNGAAILDSRKICPTGWHVSTDTDWMLLEIELGIDLSEIITTNVRGTNDHGSSLRKTINDNWIGNNSTGLSVLPAGQRYGGGNFAGLQNTAVFWTSSPYFSDNYLFFKGILQTGGLSRMWTTVEEGHSVRCVKD